MRSLLSTTLSICVALGAVSAYADFSGPAPLAWRWVQPAPAVPAAPYVDGERVFAAVGRRVYALDKATGNQIWRFPAGEPHPSTFTKGVVRFGNTIIASTDDRNVIAIDMNTGEQKWNFTATQNLLSAPVLCGKTLVLPYSDQSIMAISAEDGTETWTNSTRIFAGIKGSIAGYNDVVLVFDQNNKLYGIDSSTKKTLWDITFNALTPDVQPVFAEDAAWITSGNYIVPINPLTGTRKGQVFSFTDSLVKPPAILPGYVASVTREGVLVIADRGNPRKITRVDLGSPAVNAPSKAGNFIAVNTANGSMNIVDPATGKIIWNYILRPATKPVAGADGKTPPNYMTAAAPAVVSGDTLLLQSRDGSLLAFDKSTGVDLTPPNVEMIFPLPGSEMNPVYGKVTTNNGRQVMTPTNEYISLYFQIDDPSSGLNLNSVFVTANGKPLEVITLREGYAVVNLGDPKNRFATNGRITFKVNASDWIGNAIEKSFSLTLDNTIPPSEKPGTATNDGGNGLGGGRPGGAGMGGGGLGGGIG